MFIATVPPEPHQLRRSGMFIAARAARSPKLRRSGMFIGTGTNNDFRKIVRSGMEPFVWSPIRHAAPDGAWFSGAGALAINMPLLRSYGSLVLGGCVSAINMPLLRSYGRRAAPDSSVTSGMFIATVPPEPHQLRQERHVYSHTSRTVPQAP